MLQTWSQDILREPQPKRRKIQLACNKCRNRKTRCDGHRPACIACLERGLAAECSYEHNTHPSQRYTGRGTVIPSHSGASNTAELLSSPTQSTHCTNDFNRVDGLATVAFPREDENLYGESSTIAFVRHVMHEQPPPEHQQYKSPAPEPIRDRDESLAVYPRRQTADDYVSSFWEFVHPVFPILHKASFMSRYKEVWSSEPYKGQHNTDQADEVAFSATLNLTFALGCQFSSLVAANKRVVVADEFYQRSRRIFIYDILDTSSMPVLQMLLLTGVYLQSTRYAERCWNTVGLAIRAAQTLGLHSESPTRRLERQLTREIRRRVWHVCVTLDRLLAMTFGRPAMITRSWDIPIPLLIDDEFLQIDGDGHQPSNIPSRMGLFVYSSKLYDILDKILITFYVEPETSKPISTDDSLQKLLSNVLTFNRQLDGFHNSAPEYLRLPAKVAHSGIHMNSNIQLQAQILNCRFLYTRVILLRPLLLLSA
ncbi:hypothetical protein DL98DRAFT_429464 [Cadophora sp. DSE1049]|nr:hypothetical protein DL98DRAFT_429464 [Cadophora sp. DSE1049]